MQIKDKHKYVDALIAKHHIINRNPQHRFSYLQNVANTLGFNQSINAPIIQIAGTNGKGSTQHILWELLKASGYQCHVFRSPHLVTINERIWLNNQMIEDGIFLETLQWADQQINQPIGFFALLSIAFFKLCSDIKTDFILLETGLGGEFDATNILSKQALSIITAINFDHCDILGYELSQIAQAKAGIMRTNTNCFSDNQQPDARTTLQSHANHLHTPLSFLDNHQFSKTNNGFDLNKQSYTNPSLLGDHQKHNTALAILAYQQLVANDQQLSKNQINQVLSTLDYPGRTQTITTGSITKQLKHTLMVDGAHNPAAIKALTDYLTTINKPIYIWFSCKESKDFQKMLSTLLTLTSVIILQQDENNDRIDEKHTKLLPSDIPCFSNIDKAIDYFNQLSDGLVVACGSLHWIGHLLTLNNK